MKLNMNIYISLCCSGVFLLYTEAERFFFFHLERMKSHLIEGHLLNDFFLSALEKNGSVFWGKILRV